MAARPTLETPRAVPPAAPSAHLARRVHGHPRKRVSPQRERLLALVEANPGSSLTFLAQTLPCGWGALHYHLNKLKRAGLVRVVTAGRRCLAYPTSLGAQDPTLAQGDSILGGKMARKIALAIRERPRRDAGDLMRDLGESQRVVHYHLKRFIQAGLVRSDSTKRYRNLTPTAALETAIQRMESRDLAAAMRR